MMSTAQTGLYLIDGCKIFREGLKASLPEPEFRMWGESNSIDEALQILSKGAHSGIVVTEYPGASSEGIAKLGLLFRQTNLKFVVLAASMNCDWLRKSLAAGAYAFLVRAMSSEGLLHSLRLVVAGEKVLPSQLTPVLISGELVPWIDDTRDLSCLSDRERHVLRILVRGDSNKAIARELEIAEGTVKVHVKGVLKKLHLRNRTQAAVWALDSGLKHNSQPENHAPLPPVARRLAG